MEKSIDFHTRNNSKTNTTAQQEIATGNSPNPSQAQMIPTIKAISPATGDWVDSIIAGKVMTASVTYGT